MGNIVEQLSDGLKNLKDNSPEGKIQKIQESVGQITDNFDKGVEQVQQATEVGLEGLKVGVLTWLAQKFGINKVLDFIQNGLDALTGKTSPGKQSSAPAETNHADNDIEKKLHMTFKEFYKGGTNSERMPKLTEDDVRNIMKEEGISIYLPPVKVDSAHNFAQHRVQGHLHEGQDYAVAVGTPIQSSVEGTIEYAQDTGGEFGKLIIVKKGNVEFYYAHLSSLDVKKGDEVKAGDIIAKSGNTGRSTGPHLHEEIRYGGRNGIRINPELMEKAA